MYEISEGIDGGIETVKELYVEKQVKYVERLGMGGSIGINSMNSLVE